MAGEITEIARINGKDIRDKKLADMTNVQQASGLPSAGNLKFILQNGTNEEFEAALDSIIVSRMRELFGPALNILDKGQNVDLIPVIQKSGTSPDFTYDLGSTTPANLASVLSAGPDDSEYNSYTSQGTYWSGGDLIEVFVNSYGDIIQRITRTYSSSTSSSTSQRIRTSAGVWGKSKKLTIG